MYKVLLVDDERLILEGLRRVMPWEEHGCTVVGTACDGLQGLEMIRQLKPDMVFTDIRMPNMDGLTMLAAVASEFPRTQICVLTAFRDFDYAQRALHLGVCRYLLKPSKMEELNEAVGEMTRRLAALQPLAEASVQGEIASEAAGFVVRAALSYMQEKLYPAAEPGGCGGQGVRQPMASVKADQPPHGPELSGSYEQHTH